MSKKVGAHLPVRESEDGGGGAYFFADLPGGGLLS